MGVYFSRNARGRPDDFFLGGRRVPWWAAGISIFGTQLSAITFMAIPAKSFATDWVYFIAEHGHPGDRAARGVDVHPVLPPAEDLTTAYEYLEQSLQRLVRLLGSVSFVAFQLGRMGIVMFLPALALGGRPRASTS